MDSPEVEHKISEFAAAFGALPEITEPPRTTLSILRERTREKYWNRLLQYFLDPSAPHGLDSDFLSEFVRVVDDRTDGVELTASTLDAVQVDSEVRSDNGRPDLLVVLDEEWFICIELKVTAPETGKQTEEYASSDRLGDINTSDYRADNQRYVYLAQKTHSPPASSQFVHLPWDDVQLAIDRVFEDSRGQYPLRTTAQLSDFQDTIRDEIMSEQPYDTQQDSYVELYLENRDAIDTVRKAFDTMVENEIDRWHTQLQEYYRPDHWNDSWNCDSGKYGKIYTDKWRRDKDGELVEEWSDAAFRLEFRHRIRKEQSWKEGQVVFRTVIPKNSDDEYRDRCYELFQDRREDVESRAESTPISVTGHSRRLTDTTYSFEPTDGPEGYYTTLSEAFDEHTVLVDPLTEIYNETFRAIVQE